MPSSVDQCFRVVKNAAKVSFNLLGPDIICDIIPQLEQVVDENFEVLMEYRQDLLLKQKTDVLSSQMSEIIRSPHDHFRLHLLLNADGASFYKSNPNSTWPIQIIVLDLPIHLRIKMENRILVALSSQKPDVQTIFTNLSGQINRKFVVKHVEFSMQLHACVFDLPAYALCTNMSQFNGKYGCPFCLHPGVTMKSGKGNSRVYDNTTYPLRDAINYEEHVRLSELMEERVCGVKCSTVLSKMMPFPNGIVLDAMHAFYEGLTKQLILFMLDTDSKSCKMYIGRPSSKASINSFLESIHVPHDFVKFRSLNYVRNYKAIEFQNILLYTLFPMCVPLLHSSEVFVIALLVYAMRRANNKSMPSYLTDKIGILLDCFLKHVNEFFPSNFQKMNVHLLSHLPLHLKKFGPAFCVNMYCFERGMKFFHRMFHGTVNHSHQIVENFLLFKYCSKLVHSNDNALCGEFERVLGLKSVTNKNGQIGEGRFSINGTVLHSLQYKRRHTSRSCYCFTKDKAFCEIVDFQSNLSMTVNVLKYEMSLLELFEKPDTVDDTTYETLKSIDELDFAVVDDTVKETRNILVADVVCRCILLPLRYKGSSFCIAVRVLEDVAHL